MTDETEPERAEADEPSSEVSDTSEASTDTPAAAPDDAEASERTGDEIVATAGAPAVAEAPPDDSLQTRLLVPLLLPLLAMAAVALYVLNVSRVFLAGDSDTALVIATIITLLILIGGSIIAATPGLRTSSLAMIVGLVLVIVVSAGLIALGPSVDTGESQASAQVAQCKDPTATVAVEALSTIKFDKSNYDTTAGCVEFEIGGASGHTMQFREIDAKGFPIGTAGQPTKGSVTLEGGKTYDVYCTVDGHAQQGMVATVTVAAG